MTKFPHPSVPKEATMDVEDGVNEAIGAQKSEPVIASATVPGESLGTEKNVVAEQQWRAIHERRAAGMNVSEIGG